MPNEVTTAKILIVDDEPTNVRLLERLIAKGKPPKVALIAVLRRLVVFANAVLKSGQPWRGATTA